MLKELPLKVYIYSALALDLITVLTVVLAKRILPPTVPLFYGNPVGGAQLVTAYGLIIAPLAATSITIINIFLASYIKDEFLKKILSVASFFVSALATITIYKIVFLVGFW